MIRSPEKFREKQRIDVRTLREVTEIDPAAGRVLVRDLEGGGESWEPYEDLLIATGATPICPDIPGAGVRGIYGVCSLQAGVALRTALDERRPARGVVVGGGYIGLEMAEALVRRGMTVTLLEMGPEVMGTLDPDMGALVSRGLEAIGVRVVRGAKVEAFESSGGEVSGVAAAGETVPAEVVVLGTGVRPNTALASRAGIPLGEKGAIRVDEGMRSGVERVWSAGDCAETFHLVSGRRTHIALGTIANKQGRVAGINLAGGEARFPGVVGTAITQICGLEVARSGLQEREADSLSLAYVASRIESKTHAAYYPGAAPITVKLLGEKGSGRLLGGQIVGGRGSGKRIDIVAVALHAGMTVQQVIDLDLAYAPPFSGVWDPVQTAARELLKELKNS